MILMIFVTYNGVLGVPGISYRLLGYYPLSLDHHHIFALIIITFACQHELRLLLGRERGVDIVTCDTVFDWILNSMGKHTFGLHTISNRKQHIISTNSAFFITFSNIYSSKERLDLFKVCMIHFIFHWFIYFHMWCLHELYTWLWANHTHRLISTLHVAHLVTVVWVPTW